MSIDLSKHLHFDSLSVERLNRMIEEDIKELNNNPDQPTVNIDGHMVSREEIIKYTTDVRDDKLELYKTPHGKVVQKVFELFDAICELQSYKLHNKELDLSGLIDLNHGKTIYTVNGDVNYKLEYVMDNLRFLVMDVNREKLNK